MTWPDEAFFSAEGYYEFEQQEGEEEEEFHARLKERFFGKEIYSEAIKQEDEDDEAYDERMKAFAQKLYDEEGFKDMKYLDGEPMFRMHANPEDEENEEGGLDGFMYYTRRQNYKGEFEGGQRVGKGKMQFTDGREYEGDFFLGYFQSSDPLKSYGEGTMRWVADVDGLVKTYEGQFKKTLQSGIGTETIVDSEGNKEVYVGQFLKGVRSGKGQLEKDGKKIEAMFEDGEPIEDTIEEKEMAKAGNALLGALQKNLKNVFLEELKKQQELEKSDTLKAMGKKF